LHIAKDIVKSIGMHAREKRIGQRANSLQFNLAMLAFCSLHDAAPRYRYMSTSVHRVADVSSRSASTDALMVRRTLLTAWSPSQRRAFPVAVAELLKNFSVMSLITRR